MARAVDFKASQNIELFTLPEAETGTAVIAALKKLQIVSFSIPEASVPVEYSAQRAGSFTQLSSQAHHSEGTKMWTFDTTLRGTVDSILLATDALFEDATSEAALSSSYAFPQASYKHGATAAVTRTFFFRNGGSADAYDHLIVRGCVGTGFTLTEDMGSEGGELVVTINWATAYMPTYTDTDISGDLVFDSGIPKNIRALAHATTVLGTKELVVHSWELSCSRTIERIGFADTTQGTFNPLGYAMTGGFEVTGSITAVRNTDTAALLAKFHDSLPVVLNIQETDADFIIAAPICYINEPTIDSGGPMLMQTIPFTIVGSDTVSVAGVEMLGITAVES